MFAGLQPKWLLALVEYFIHPLLRQNSDRLRRIRMLIAVELLFVAMLGLVCVLLPLAVSARSLWIGEAICVLTLFGFAGLLVLLRSGGNYPLCTAAAMLMMFLPLIVGVGVSGGALHSPVTPLLIVLPLMGFFFGGLRAGSAATALTLIALFILALLDLSGVGIIQSIDPQQREAVALLVNSLLFPVSAGMAFVYEFTAGKLQRERDDEHQRYVQLAKTDPLTGLENRRNFEAVVTQHIEVSAALQPIRQFALCFIDLDGFKAINDRHGHNVGDEVLRVVADRLRSASRAVDLVGRHGGDEFMLMLDELADRATLETTAQRLINSIEQPISASVGMVNVSASIGFAQYPVDGGDLESLKKAADIAMYTAKRNRAGWVFYRQDLTQLAG